MSTRTQSGNHSKRTSGRLRAVAHAELPTRYGRFTIYGFQGRGAEEEAVALVRGNLSGKSAPLVRVHSQCLTGDVLTSLRCDCRAQLELSLQKIGRAPSGILLYLPQEGRGIGLAHKIHAYKLQEKQGLDTVEANERLGFPADKREYGVSVRILTDLGVHSVRLLSNNPRKLVGIEGYGLSVSEWLPLEIPASDSTRRYLTTKKEKLGHKLTSV